MKRILYTLLYAVLFIAFTLLVASICISTTLLLNTVVNASIIETLPVVIPALIVGNALYLFIHET